MKNDNDLLVMRSLAEWNEVVTRCNQAEAALAELLRLKHGKDAIPLGSVIHEHPAWIEYHARSPAAWAEARRIVEGA